MSIENVVRRDPTQSVHYWRYNYFYILNNYDLIKNVSSFFLFADKYFYRS